MGSNSYDMDSVKGPAPLKIDVKKAPGDLNLLPDVDHSKLPQSKVSDKPKS